MIETDRLILRRWRPADRAPYAAMLADPEVGDWLGGVVKGAEADAQIDRAESELGTSGWGYLALERKADGVFLGRAGLRPIYDHLPLAPGIEIAWTLARAAWGQGYATEAARTLLEDGFTRRGLDEILAFTAQTNRRSRAIMERLGMVRDPARDFDHPRLAQGHPLRRTVVYVARGGKFG